MLARLSMTAMAEVWPHMIHAWAMWNAKLTAGREALKQASEFLRRWVTS
jgi:epsilon-lactone hydrolase